MVKSQENELNNIDVDQLKAQMKGISTVIQALNKTIRIRILLLLWAYKEQSINELCEKLGKSWPTVTKHIDILEKSGILEVREEKSRGPKNKKIYSVIPDLLQSTRFGYDFLKLPPEDVVEILSQDLKSDAKTLEIIKKIFDDLTPYHEEIGRNLREMTPNRKNLEEFYKKKHVTYYVEVLDEEEFEFYSNRYDQFLEELEAFRIERKKKDKKKRTEKPYVVLDIRLPIKEIQEARFKRFWKT
ncbi:MAG: transcriptional regulator [Promethearchaeota archaeon]|nr:MAG: transcriptional regulator [Candidatus Lokiarchaeota archaeon]